MHLIMFDIDGTLVQSYEFDGECYAKAVESIIGAPVNKDWSSYSHVTDAGILDQIIEENGLAANRDRIHREVKTAFTIAIELHLSSHSVEPIPGSVECIRALKDRDDVVIAVATGGWRETALLKLEHAGIDCEDIVIASSCDATSRIDIMQHAEVLAGDEFVSKHYVGDAAWDKQASLELGYQFVLMGNKLDHTPQLKDFSCMNTVYASFGLATE